MNARWEILFLLFCLCAVPSYTSFLRNAPKEKVLACFVDPYATQHYQNEKFRFKIEDMKPELCTHIIYSSALINGTTFNIMARDPIEEEKYWSEFLNLRARNPKAKLLMNIGGWSEGSEDFRKMNGKENLHRLLFIMNVHRFLRYHKFDGVNIHWNTPGPSVPEDKETLTIILKDLSQALKENYLLTMLMHAHRYRLQSYDINEINKIVDIIFLNTFDYNGPWNEKVMPHSYLGSSTSEENTIRNSLHYLEENIGTRMGKIVIGVSCYGRSYVMTEDLGYANPFERNCLPDGFPSSISNIINFAGFNEICYLYNVTNKEYESPKNYETSVAFASSPTHVIVYDNPKSMINKVKLVNEEKLGGIMVYSVETDDFTGICKDQNIWGHHTDHKFPILRTVYNLMYNKMVTGTTTSTTPGTITDTSTSITSIPTSTTSTTAGTTTDTSTIITSIPTSTTSTTPGTTTDTISSTTPTTSTTPSKTTGTIATEEKTPTFETTISTITDFVTRTRIFDNSDINTSTTSGYATNSATSVKKILSTDDKLVNSPTIDSNSHISSNNSNSNNDRDISSTDSNDTVIATTKTNESDGNISNNSNISTTNNDSFSTSSVGNENDITTTRYNSNDGNTSDKDGYKTSTNSDKNEDNTSNNNGSNINTSDIDKD